MRHRGFANVRRQRGVAIITALLLTALAITVVTSLFWQQQVQVRSMENQRLHLQTKWILRGALDWARLILRQDALSTGIGAPVTLNGIWATPLAETRLDDYVERERVDGDNYNATLSGQISDAQARYNLTNLATGKITTPGQIAVFQRLLTNLQIDPSLALRTAQAVANGQQLAPATTDTAGGTTGTNTAGTSTTGTTGTGTGTTGTGTGTTGTGTTTGTVSGGGEPLPFSQVDDLLSIAGFTPQNVVQLRDYVTVLPTQTPLNVNTATPQVLAALVPNLSLSEATSIAARRQGASYNQIGDFTTPLGERNVAGDVPIGVTSTFFLVTSHILLGRAELDAEALIQRQGDNQVTTTLMSIREN
jgi:general secretion pathway protein K